MCVARRGNFSAHHLRTKPARVIGWERLCRVWGGSEEARSGVARKRQQSHAAPGTGTGAEQTGAPTGRAGVPAGASGEGERDRWCAASGLLRSRFERRTRAQDSA